MAEALYELYRQGRSLHDVWRLNQKWSFGQVVHAAVDGRWALRRSAEAATALPRAKERALLAVAEGVELTADMMAALSKLHRDNIARFLQTGNIEDLGPALSSTTLAQLGKLTEMLMKLTGQDQTKKVAISGEVTHSGAVAVAAASSADGRRLLDMAAEKKRAEREKRGA